MVCSGFFLTHDPWPYHPLETPLSAEATPLGTCSRSSPQLAIAVIFLGYLLASIGIGVISERRCLYFATFDLSPKTCDPLPQKQRQEVVSLLLYTYKPNFSLMDLLMLVWGLFGYSYILRTIHVWIKNFIALLLKIWAASMSLSLRWRWHWDLMGPTRVHFVDDPWFLRCKLCRKTGNLQVKLSVWMEFVLVHTEVVFENCNNRKVPHPAFKKLQRRLAN